jgi:hypothetical protein
MTEVDGMVDDLTGLGPQGFERLCQALATYVLGPGIDVFGDGPDGGREAAFADLRHYPTREAPWSGHGVLQAKFKQSLLGTGGDTTWLRKQLKAELAAWADSGSRRVRDGQRPQYLIVATNIPLSGVPRTGGKDRINSLIAEFAQAIGLKDWRIWDAVQIGAFLDAHPDVRRSFAALITPSEVLAALREKLEYPPEVAVVVSTPAPVIKPGQPGNEPAFMPVYETAGGAARLGQPLGKVQDVGKGLVQYFDGGAAGPAVICAAYEKVPVAATLEIWNAIRAIGADAPGGGTTGAGIPLSASPPAALIGADSDCVTVAGGAWGPGRLVRSGGRGWLWQPEISFDSEAFRDRDAWTGRDGAMDLRLRVAARIPVVVAGLRITEAGRSRMLETLQHNGLLTTMTRLAARYGLDPATLTWAETPEPVGRNNSRSAAYQASANGSGGRPAITGLLVFFLPTGVAGEIQAMADLRISFEAVRPDYVTDSDGLAEIPADLQITGPELVAFLAKGWQITTAILPLCATADLADLSPAGAPHLELYIQNEHRPNTGQSRQVRTLDMVDLSHYGQPRQDPPGDLSVGVTTPLGVSEKEIEDLTLAALVRMTEDFGFRKPPPSGAC